MTKQPEKTAARQARRNILYGWKKTRSNRFGRLFFPLRFCRHGKGAGGKGAEESSVGISGGSLTVEASLAVPLFFLCMVTLICLINMYGMVAKRTVELQQKAEKAGMLAGVTRAVGVTQTEAVSVIDLWLPVYYEPVWTPVPTGGVVLSCRGRVYSWVGRDPEENTGEQEKEEDRLVYVTENGEVYHTTSKCTHISLSIQAVSSNAVGHMRNAGGGRYHACEKCVKRADPADVVYITNEGDRYHNSETCSGLTRNVRMIPLSEAKGLRMCSRCQKLEGEEEKTS